MSVSHSFSWPISHRGKNGGWNGGMAEEKATDRLRVVWMDKEWTVMVEKGGNLTK